jgi:hypothetical protein
VKLLQTFSLITEFHLCWTLVSPNIDYDKSKLYFLCYSNICLKWYSPVSSTNFLDALQHVIYLGMLVTCKFPHFWLGASSLQCITSADEVRRAAIYHLDDCRISSNLPQPKLTAFQKAYNCDGNMFTWMHDPSHKYEFTRHNACIRATIRLDPQETLLQGSSEHKKIVIFLNNLQVLTGLPFPPTVS